MVHQSRFGDWILKLPRIIGIKARGMAIAPCLPIIIRTDVDLNSMDGKCLLAHERCHIRQMQREGFLRHKFWYYLDILSGIILYHGDIKRAYKECKYEVEARAAAQYFMDEHMEVNHKNLPTPLDTGNHQ